MNELKVTVLILKMTLEDRTIPIDTHAYDWSGTLSDDRRPVYAANMKLLKFHGKPTMVFDEWLPQTKLTAAEFLQSQGIKCNPDEEAERYRKYYKEVVDSGIVPVVYSDAKTTLEFLRKKRKRLVLLSSHPEDRLIHEATEYGLLHYFDQILGSRTDKTIALQAVCETGCDPQRLLYTGDTVYDIQAAKAARVKSAAVCKGYHNIRRLAAEKPDFLHARTSDVIALFKNGRLI